MTSLSQGRTAAAQCGLFTHKPVPVIFEPPCIFVGFITWINAERKTSYRIRHNVTIFLFGASYVINPYLVLRVSFTFWWKQYLYFHYVRPNFSSYLHLTEFLRSHFTARSVSPSLCLVVCVQIHFVQVLSNPEATLYTQNNTQQIIRPAIFICFFWTAGRLR